MTDNFPELTVQNVIYWYWNCVPPLSIIDIAKEVGCSSTTVHRFMEKNKISRRDLSNANLNSWLWED